MAKQRDAAKTAAARVRTAAAWARKNRVNVLRAARDANRLDGWAKRDPQRFPMAGPLAERLGNPRVLQPPHLDGEELLPPLGDCLLLGRAVIVSGRFEDRGGEPDSVGGWRLYREGKRPLWTLRGSMRTMMRLDGRGEWQHPDGRFWVPDMDPLTWIFRLLTDTTVAEKDGVGVPALVEVVEAIRGWESGGLAIFPAGMEALRMGGGQTPGAGVPPLVWPAPTAALPAEPRVGFLPFGRGPTHPEGLEVPPALALFDMFGGVSMRNGRGVPHVAKVTVWVLGGLSPEARRGGIMLPQYFEARRIANELWSEIPRGGRAIRGVRAALDGMTRLEAGRIVLPDGRGAELRPLMIGAMPASLDDAAEIFVRLPPSDGRGSLYDRDRAWHWGMIAAPPWRLYFAACWLRDRFATNGRGIELTVPEVRRGREGVILDATGKPVMRRRVAVVDWRHPAAVKTSARIRNEAANRLPVYSLPDLTRAACGPFPPDASASMRAMRRERTLKALESLRNAGDLDFEKATDRNGRRGLRIAAVDPKRRRALLTAGQ